MLTQVHIQNLKCFHSLALPIAPLTLLTGFNAAGKSTATHALLLIAQALRSGAKHQALSLNGALVELGTAGEVLCHNSGVRYLGLGAQSDEAKMNWEFDVEARTPTGALILSSISVEDAAGQLNVKREFDPTVALVPGDGLSEAVGALVQKLTNLIYISAVRDALVDVYPAPSDDEPIHADVGVRGEFAPWWYDRLADFEIDERRRIPGEEGLTLRRQLSAWADTMFPGAEANASALQRTRLTQLQLRTGATDEWRRPSNIGYGLSYAFPVLVAGLLAEPGQIIILDSPEAHLHPRAQSAMGSFLASMAVAGVTLIVESHSDHVLNGIRLAVKSGKVPPADVVVHFFSGARPAERAHGVISSEIDRHGGLDAWPEGFFDQAEKDLAAIAGLV